MFNETMFREILLPSSGLVRGGSSPSDRVRGVSCSVQILGEKNYNLKASICWFFENFCEIF